MLRAYLIPNPGICDCMSHHFTNYTEQKKKKVSTLTQIVLCIVSCDLIRNDNVTTRLK